MDDLVDTSTWQYAVICVQAEPGPEQLVIEYHDEKTLRGLIAAPSIAALSYTSRAYALNNLDCCAKITTSLKRLLITVVIPANITLLTECRGRLRRLARSFGTSRTSRAMRNILHNGLAAALIIFYSKNILSSTVRAFISL